MIAAIRADFDFNRRLRRAQHGRLMSLLRALLSKGLFVQLVQRLDRHVLEQRKLRKHSVPILALRLLVNIGNELVVLFTKVDMNGTTEMAGGVFLSDKGNLVIGANRIGCGTIIHHRVTIGIDLRKSGRPTIGNDVWIGSDCVLYGDIHVGDGATVLSGSIVTKSVPPRAVVAGNPARVIRLDYDNSQLRGTMCAEAAQRLLELRAAEA